MDRRYTAVGTTTVRWIALVAIVAAAVFAAAGATAATARAQSIRGVVLHPDSATRAQGVIVVAADEHGVVARTLSADNGDFDLRVPGAGTYTIRLLRVGFRPTTLTPLSVPTAGVTGFRAVLGAEAVMLSVVTVKSDNVCGTTEDAGRVIAQLWEEARTALTATQLSAGTRALDVDWQVFRFDMVRRTQRVSGRVLSARTGATDRPFVSASADSLADDGYVIDEERERTFRAPDAAALLSNRFAATHCFRIDAPSRAHPQWVGIAFRPTQDRNWIRDIEGTLWIDRASSELRLLEFRYTNLPNEIDVPEVGGFVEFVRVPTGHWLIARWAIRAPKLVRRSRGGGAVPGGGGSDIVVVEAISVIGGEVTHARRGTTELYGADPRLVASDGLNGIKPSQPSACGAGIRDGVSLSGTVRAGGPEAGAVVLVTWTPTTAGAQSRLSTVTDDRGAWTITCAPEGFELTVTASNAGLRSAVRVVPLVAGRNFSGLELQLVDAPGKPE